MATKPKAALNGSEWVGAADAARFGQVHQKQLTQHAKMDHFRRAKDPTTGRWKYNVADLEAYAARDRTKGRKRKYVRPSSVESAASEKAPAPRNTRNGHANGDVAPGVVARVAGRHAVSIAPVPPVTSSRAEFFAWIDAGIQANWLGGDEALEVIKRQLPIAPSASH